MSELFRDTAFGHLVRFASRGKYFRYEEEIDPSLYKHFIDEKKSGYLAHHGDTNAPEDGKEPETLGGVRTREDQYTGQGPPRLSTNRRSSSEQTRVDESNGNMNHVSGVQVDKEKGRDVHLVSWWGDNDPENPQNWSLFKRCFVTFEICLLTTSVYIGSSIYSAGTTSVEATFGVGQVPATLGLCLFVAGYGLGPMFW